VEGWSTLGTLESVAVLGLSVGFIDAYNTVILQVWYHSIDMHFIMLHAKFEDGSSISVSKDKATRYKILHLEIEKNPKTKTARPLYFKPRFFFQTLVPTQAELPR
jgi:hypothetical protein